jgi:hypothetical protein
MGSGWANCIYQAIVQLSAGSFPSASIPKVYVSTIGAVDASGILFSSGPVSMTGAGGLSITNGVTAATGVFTGTGNGVYDLTLSSGLFINAGGVTAPWFSGPLRGTADFSTNLAGGAAGQHPYQSASGATLFLPSMGTAGIIVGNGVGVAPSTTVLQGTANQITVTQSGTAVTLATPQNINSGAAPTFTGTNFTGIPESGVTNLVRPTWRARPRPSPGSRRPAPPAFTSARRR